jgi:hypothetical protein
VGYERRAPCSADVATRPLGNVGWATRRGSFASAAQRSVAGGVDEASSALVVVVPVATVVVVARGFAVDAGAVVRTTVAPATTGALVVGARINVRLPPPQLATTATTATTVAACGARRPRPSRRPAPYVGFTKR